MFPVGDQVEVIGELDGAGQLLQDVYAEALAAQFGVGLRVADNTGRRVRKSGVTHTVNTVLFLISRDQKPSLAAGTVVIFSLVSCLFQRVSAKYVQSNHRLRQRSEGQAVAEINVCSQVVSFEETEESS